MRRISGLIAILVAIAGLATAALTGPAVAQEPDPPILGSLVAQFPATIAGSPLEVITFRGDEWLAGFEGTTESAQFSAYLAGLGVGEEALGSQVALASGVFVNSLGASTALTAIAVCPAGPFDLVSNTLALYGPVGESPVADTIPGELVTGTASTPERQIRAMARSNVVWLVDAAEPALPEIMAAIPADPVACL
jgi:hypothetical protein